MDKWFCFVNIDAFDFCNIKCNAGQIEDLLDKYEGVQPGYHMNKNIGLVSILIKTFRIK